MHAVSQPNRSPAAATDVAELISDLDGGQFEHALSIALSQAAAAAVDNKKGAEVNIKLAIKPIAGTHQIHLEHTLAFKTPTSNGKRTEEASQTTTLHVGKGGKLTLSPESQAALFDRAGVPNGN